MTRKDYIIIANAIRYSLPNGQAKADFVNYLSESFERDNERFDVQKFHTACYQSDDTLLQEERL